MLDFILRKCESLASKISTYLWKIRVVRLYYKRNKK
jgi:hypothetical protein